MPSAVSGSGTGIDLNEPHAFLDLLKALGIRLVCITAGSPYYNPHIQRPALFPPSDGYQPPEDPLVGVARQIAVVDELKQAHPDLVFVGSGYSYLQEWLPNVAQYVVRTGMTDLVGVGRMILTYPDLPADVLAGRPLYSGNASAVPSATAPLRRAMAWSPAAIRWTIFIRHDRKRNC